MLEKALEGAQVLNLHHLSDVALYIGGHIAREPVLSGDLLGNQGRITAGKQQLDAGSPQLILSKQFPDGFLKILPAQRNFEVKQVGGSVKPVEVIIEERDPVVHLKEIIKDPVTALQAEVGDVDPGFFVRKELTV